jgi:formylglycine-generating enzyme required for sulfatase activity
MWLSRKTGKGYRLLSEAEWEYIARATTTTPYWWGSSFSTDQANYNGTRTYADLPTGENRQKTLPVASFSPNPWGFYQVHGNSYDWTEDCFHDDYFGAPADGSAWAAESCKGHVVRGGAWSSAPWMLRSATVLGSPLTSETAITVFEWQEHSRRDLTVSGWICGTV